MKDLSYLSNKIENKISAKSKQNCCRRILSIYFLFYLQINFLILFSKNLIDFLTENMMKKWQIFCQPNTKRNFLHKNLIAQNSCFWFFRKTRNYVNKQRKQTMKILTCRSFDDLEPFDVSFCRLNRDCELQKLCQQRRRSFGFNRIVCCADKLQFSMLHHAIGGLFFYNTNFQRTKFNISRCPADSWLLRVLRKILHDRVWHTFGYSLTKIFI